MRAMSPKRLEGRDLRPIFYSADLYSLLAGVTRQKSFGTKNETKGSDTK